MYEYALVCLLLLVFALGATIIADMYFSVMRSFDVDRTVQFILTLILFVGGVAIMLAAFGATAAR